MVVLWCSLQSSVGVVVLGSVAVFVVVFLWWRFVSSTL